MQLVLRSLLSLTKGLVACAEPVEVKGSWQIFYHDANYEMHAEGYATMPRFQESRVERRGHLRATLDPPSVRRVFDQL